MKKLTLICTACMFVPALTLAQQPHVHGAGKLLIGQEGQTWELMFEIPAANAIGFEHLPTNDAEIAKIKTYIDAVKSNTGLVAAPSDCRLEGVEQSIEDVFLSELGEHDHDHHSHDEHDHDEHDHLGHHDDHDHEEHKHQEHDHDDHEHHGAHYSVDFTMSFSCENESTEFVINVFDSAFELNELNTEWFTESGQGAATLTPASRSLSFDN